MNVFSNIIPIVIDESVHFRIFIRQFIFLLLLNLSYVIYIQNYIYIFLLYVQPIFNHF